MALLRFRGVHKAYGRSSGRVHILDDLTFDIEAGGVLALVGENGAGKSTAIRIGCGLVLPDRGSVELAGADPAREPRVLRRLGVLLEGSRNLYWRLSALENLDYFGGLKGMRASHVRARARKLIEKFHLEAKAKAPVQTLSKGMQQRVSIMVALINQPEVLFLDEPTLGLDRDSCVLIEGHIREAAAQGTAVCITSHQPDVIRSVATDLIALRQGRVVYHGSPGRIGAMPSATAYRIVMKSDVDEEASHALTTRFPGSVVCGREIGLRCHGAELLSALSLLDASALVSLRRAAEDAVGQLLETAA
jgi:ABC-2 type transport system ATP-binding protein